jgi:hypothetical protein
MLLKFHPAMALPFRLSVFISAFKRQQIQPYRSLVMLLGSVAIAACSGGLKGDGIAQAIKEDVVTLGGTSLKSVICPAQITPQKDARFECTGELDTGYTFTIGVTQRDDQGSVVWDVPNTPGLLNMAKIETLIQDALKVELGDRPTVDCDGTYKPIRPGQSFDCKLEYANRPKSSAGGKSVPSALKQAPAEKIVVLIDQQGSIGWQRVFKNSGAKVGTKLPTTASQPAASTPDASSSARPAPAIAAPANPALANPAPTGAAPVSVSSPVRPASPTKPVDQPGSSSEPTYQDTLKWQD